MTDPFRPAPAVALLSPAVGTGNVGDHFIEMAVRRLLRDDVVFQRFSIRRPLRDAEIEAINQASCALLCGTNLYQRDWESALTPATLSRLCVPVVPVGVGGSAARAEELAVGETTRRMIQALHARCPVGSVRDPYSAAVVSRAGVENFALTGCPVLFWSRQEEPPPVRPVGGRRVVLTARNWLMHRWPDNVDHPVQVNLLRRLLKSLPADRLLFAVHEEFDSRLVDLLEIPPDMVFRSDSPADYVRLYSDPENVVLAMRLHAGMLGLANGLPVVFVGHDTRTYSFCEMMGLDYVELFGERCADECVARLRAILDGDVSPFEGVGTRYRRLRAAMRDFLEANGLPAWHAPSAAPAPVASGGR